MNILLADEDSRVRSALKLALSQEGGKPSFRECTDMDSFLLQSEAEIPDLVILDWDFPGKAAAVLLFGLKGLVCTTKVIVLGRRAEAEKYALACGADAFFCKTDPPELLLAAIRIMFRDPRMDLFHASG